MFVISVKSNKLKNLCVIALTAVIITIGAVYFVSTNADKPVASIGNIQMKAGNEEERIAFFAQFGYEVKEEPAEVKEVVIPAVFDDVYNNYNEIQKSQNLDLEKYKGARVKHWSYEIVNYPGYEDANGVIRGNILVYNGTVIGCDISSTELQGFMNALLPKSNP